MTTGSVIETEQGKVKETSLGVMAAAGGEVIALVPGLDPAPLKEELAAHGAAKIVHLQASGGDITQNPDLAALALARAVEELGLTALLGTASTTGKDLFARLAADLDLPLISDCIKVDLAARTGTKSHFSGKTFATLTSPAPVFLATVRPNAIEPSPRDGAGEMMEFIADVADSGALKLLEVKGGDSQSLDLTEAPVIVTGGRAIGSAENYKILEDCAAKLGGAVGASRAAVDAGYADHGMQVGQTGKTVSPRLYIACGVSGAVQHFAGMKTAKVIVAVNEDKDAPIFAKCDYGIVGDLFEVVPALTEKL
ncbi:MAG: electron transfer flavoprotein subunit alpha/FixB family protein [Desulfobacterales bacterium]|nr:electron transfer flavoprotein subunit alpha/FixB family protein [Desulfobacterales bacterium]